MKYENHIAEKEEIRKIKEEFKEKCKKSKTVAIASFDMQQVIHLPISNENAKFYKRSLANYNLTRYEIHLKSVSHGTKLKPEEEVTKSQQLYVKDLKTMMKKASNKCIYLQMAAVAKNKNSNLPAMMLYTVENSKTLKQYTCAFF